MMQIDHRLRISRRSTFRRQTNHQLGLASTIAGVAKRASETVAERL
jgi:hypothetical protein